MPRGSKQWVDDAPGVMTGPKLEHILRHYPEFRELYEREGIEEIEVNGLTINVHDILIGIKELPPRQRQALVLCCLYNMREVDAAVMMGFKGKHASPVGRYKRIALKTLVQRHWGMGVGGS